MKTNAFIATTIMSSATAWATPDVTTCAVSDIPDATANWTFDADMDGDSCEGMCAYDAASSTVTCTTFDTASGSSSTVYVSAGGGGYPYEEIVFWSNSADGDFCCRIKDAGDELDVLKIVTDSGDDEVHAEGYSPAGYASMPEFAGYFQPVSGSRWDPSLTVELDDGSNEFEGTPNLKSECRVFGGDDVDIVNGCEGPNYILGHGGADTLRGGAEEDLIYGGNSFCNGTDSGDLILGRADADFLYGCGGDDEIIGGPGPDNLYGGDGEDFILGMGGNDDMYGGDGGDTICDDDDNDRYYGEAGNDRLWHDDSSTTPTTMDGGSNIGALTDWCDAPANEVNCEADNPSEPLACQAYSY